MIKIISSEKDLSILVPEKLARKYNLYPMEINDDDLVVGIEDENIYAVQDLRLVTNKNIILRCHKNDKDYILPMCTAYEVTMECKKEMFDKIIDLC